MKLNSKVTELALYDIRGGPGTLRDSSSATVAPFPVSSYMMLAMPIFPSAYTKVPFVRATASDIGLTENLLYK